MDPKHWNTDSDRELRERNGNPFTFDQVKGPAERFIVGVVMYGLGAWGVKTDDTIAVLAASFAAFLVSLVYAWWVNRPAAIRQSATEIPHTLVVETKPGTSLAAVAESVAAVHAVDRVVTTEAVARQTSDKVQSA